ncbi:MAG TPA: hypothetical protein PK020_20590 [Ilumatobacteraceae bacterium]|nr:hypothetical protein [Ilumatobacteraceae bacterium]
MSFEELDSRWRQRHPNNSGIIESLGAQDEEAVAIEAALTENLRLGRFNLVLAVDRINDGLRRIVEFMNDRTSADLSVVTMELRYSKHGDVEMLVPTVFGAELARAKAQKAGTKVSWSESDVHDYLETHWPSEAPVVARILDALRLLPGLSFVGTSAITPSLIARWDGPNGVTWPFVVYTSKQPYLRINFHWMTALPEADLLQLAAALEQLPGSTVSSADVVAKKFKSRPSLPVATVLDTTLAQGAFVAAMRALLTST